jgi:F0F1-type ATP synthase delta subunit
MLNSQTLAHTLLKLSEGKDAEEQIEEFFKFLKKKNLQGLLPQIKEQVQRLQQHADDYNTLIISSAHTLNEQELSQVVEISGAPKEVTIVQEVNPDLIGSFTARYRGTMYDGSLKSAVSQMNKALNV